MPSALRPDDFHHHDVIVIGGGHAGTEAALAAARSGARTLLLTHNIETVGAMSCNPAIGGIGKGHLVKEVDALGGAMAHAADLAGIQWRTLNASKGPAVRATRCQADRNLYRLAIRRIVENQPNLTIFQAACDDLVIEGDAVRGAVTNTGLRFTAGAVVLTLLVLADSLDGSIAALTTGGTQFGAFLDSTLDRIADWALLAGVVIFFILHADWWYDISIVGCMVSARVWLENHVLHRNYSIGGFTINLEILA